MSFNVFDVAASGMHAQRLKMDTISSNIANINTTRGPDGSPGVYKKKSVTFEAIYTNRLSSTTPPFPNGENRVFFDKNNGEMALKGGIFYDEKELSQGVRVSSIHDSKNPLKVIYDPGHPDSNEDGYVTLPNVNIVEEMIDMVAASKSYEANATAAETTKTMINVALKI